MRENINLRNFPKESGVYWFINEDEEVIYVGSSKNLHNRMIQHQQSIKLGENNESQKDLYQFLQSNQFTVNFELAYNYRQKEQELIEKNNPRFNQKRSYTGLGQKSDKDYNKKYYKKFRDERLTANLNWNHTHQNELNDYCANYYQQKCIYEDEVLSLSALSGRLARKGFKHPTQEAKKYLIEEKEFHIV